MSKLYIIGNGFDIKHGLPSRYSDFAMYCEQNFGDLYERINKLFTKISKDKDSLWSNFEHALGLPDESVLQEYQRTHDSDCRDDEFLSMLNNLKCAFRDWVVNLKRKTNETLRIYEFDSSDYFVSFNYTDTLEKVYSIDTSHLFHVHGFAQPDEEELFAGYIFGHSRDELIQTEDNKKSDDLKIDFINSLRKDYKDAELETKLNEWDVTFNDIVVRGHSMDSVDHRYYKVLLRMFPYVNWTIEYHGCKDCYRKLRSIVSLSFPKKHIRMVNS